MRVDTDAVASGRVKIGHLAGAWREGARVFGIDPTLHRMATEDYVFLFDRQGQTAGYAQLLLDDIDAGDHFGHWLFHLNPGVHLNEVELTVLVEELKSASTPIADVQTGLDAGVVNKAAGFRIDIRRRGLFQNFLVAALHGAIPVTQVNGIALAVGKYLNFHVARPLQELFQINGIVT